VPILLMALLALLVFGLIGILLAAAVVLEHSKHKRLDQVAVAHSGPSGTPSLHPKV
jgi:hypothetical protein